MNYVFKSERLGFRNWLDTDLEVMSEINASEAVMEFFPGTQDRDSTQQFIKRMQDHFEENGFCYFAVDVLETNQMIGFIGICNQDYGDVLGKFTDVGWRLHPSSWGNGFATEGANACLDYVFDELKYGSVYAVATANNVKSISVMKKAGMQYELTFDHPKLLDNEILKSCVRYKKMRPAEASRKY